MSSKTEKIQKSAKTSTILAENGSRCAELSEFMCIFAIDKSKNVMGIKRNKLAEPQWDSFEYAKIDKGNLFSYDLWKQTINWNLLLEHIKKTEGACQMINEYIYPSRLFTASIDMLEANICILNDIFYYEIGIHPKADTKETWFIMATHYLRFWNMDWYKEMKMIYDGLHRIENHLIKCLKQKPLLDIADEVFKKSNYARAFQNTLREPGDDIFNNCAYAQKRSRLEAAA